MAWQTLPNVARQTSAAQRREQAEALRAIRKAWRKVGDNLDAGFMRAAPEMVAVIETAQRRTVEAVANYVPAMLEAQGGASANVPVFTVAPAAFVGFGADGYPIETMVTGARVETIKALERGVPYTQAKAHADRWLQAALSTLLADTARGVIGSQTYARPVAGYTRMLVGQSCGRCIILAGRVYKSSQAFDRHPHCDCIHIPVAESKYFDTAVNPAAYLNSLDEAQLARVLGSKANARVWTEFAGRDGQSVMNQLVNAYRRSGAVRKGQQYGRNIKYSTEGITARGVAFQQMMQNPVLRSMGTRKSGGFRVAVAPRLMPETIFEIAGADKERARKMLIDYGWLG